MVVRELTTEDVLEVLRKRWQVIAVLAVLGAGLGWELARVLPKKFVSQTVVLVEQPTVPGDYVRPVVVESVDQELGSMQQEILSRTRLEPVIRQFNLYPEDINRVPMDDLVARLQKAINVSPIQAMAETGSEGLPGFTVAVSFSDPHTAQQLSSTITSMFMEENSKARQQSAEETSDFLSGQLVEAKTKLDEQDAKLADFKRRYMGTLPDEAQENMNVLAGLTSQLDATTQALSRAQQDKSFAESMLAQQLANLQTTQSGAQSPDAMQQQLVAMQAQLAALQTKYTDDFPDVIKAKADIASLQKRIAEGQQNRPQQTQALTKPTVEPAQIEGLRAQVHQHEVEIAERTAQQDELQKQIKMYQDRVQSSPGTEQEYKSLTRDYQTALDFYNDLLKKRDQSAMATDLEKRQEGEQFQVLDAANLPTSPSFPNVPLFVSGGVVVGVGLSLGFFLLMEMIDHSLRNEKEVEALLHLPVLAMLPSIKVISISDSGAPSLGAGAHL